MQAAAARLSSLSRQMHAVSVREQVEFCAVAVTMHLSCCRRGLCQYRVMVSNPMREENTYTACWSGDCAVGRAHYCDLECC